jgi:hypothetical protein
MQRRTAVRFGLATRDRSNTHNSLRRVLEPEGYPSLSRLWPLNSAAATATSHRLFVHVIVRRDGPSNQVYCLGNLGPSLTCYNPLRGLPGALYSHSFSPYRSKCIFPQFSVSPYCLLVKVWSASGRKLKQHSALTTRYPGSLGSQHLYRWFCRHPSGPILDGAG